MMQNVFSDIFENENICFDKRTNEFSIEVKKIYPVKLKNNTSSDNIKILTENALNRISRYISDEKDIPEIIIQNNKMWNLKFKDSEFSYTSIYELVKNLRYIQ